MLRGKPLRQMRSNSLNVPDGAVALSLEIPHHTNYRKGSMCSCSRCLCLCPSHDHERSKSGMTSSTDADTISQYSLRLSQNLLNSREALTSSRCTSPMLPMLASPTKRSASADYVRQQSSPATGDALHAPPLGAIQNTSFDSLCLPTFGTSPSRISLSPTPSIDPTVGQVCFRLVYDCEKGCLDVHVLECRDLPHFGRHNPNAIVYVSLLPDDGYEEHSRVKTKVRRNSFSPVFGDVLKFANLTKFELDDRTLLFQIYHVDTFSKKSLLGEGQIRIEEYPWSSGDAFWLPLYKDVGEVSRPCSALDRQSSPDFVTRRGALRFELWFVLRDDKRMRGDVHFVAKSGNNLTGDPPILAKKPFVKANMLSNRKIVISARSCLAEFSNNGHEPFWNYDIVIQDQSLEKMKRRALEISVWDRENSNNNRYIGRLLFYLNDPNKPEKITQTFWRQIIENPSTKIIDQLQLQP